MSRAFVLGNGTSREHFDLQRLVGKGKIYACNAVYRTFAPDYLIAVDPKMVHEIVGNNYDLDGEVWTNYNKAYDKYSNLRYFDPNKGWSSGPTALWKATKDWYQEIWILGFDYTGLFDGKRVNNIYSSTPNYKKSEEPATYYGNWLRQTETVIRENSDITFYRVIKEGDFCPTVLNSYANYKIATYLEFEKAIFG
jgi:hypothetical protein